jgi:flagellum-specific ATP synthase
MTQKACAKIRTLMATYQNNEAAIVSGIYEKGNSPIIDEAIEMHGPIEEFLTQEEYEPSSMEETLDKLSSLSDIKIPEYEYAEFIDKTKEQNQNTIEVENEEV